MKYRKSISFDDDVYREINRIRGLIMNETIENNTFTQVVNIAIRIGLEQKDRIKKELRNESERRNRSLP